MTTPDCSLSGLWSVLRSVPSAVRAPSAQESGGPFVLPSGAPDQVHFVADLPYGHMCRLKGGVLPSVIPAILRAYPAAKITFVLPRAAIGDAGVRSPRPIRLRALKKGRMILRV